MTACIDDTARGDIDPEIAFRIVDAIKLPYGPLIDNNKAVGDPPSTHSLLHVRYDRPAYCIGLVGIGVAVLLANWTRTDPEETKFAKAATNQLMYLFNDAPHTPDGAISHRLEEPQLW